MVTVPLPDVNATEALGATLASLAAKGDVIFLSGELGAGKTSLTRGYLRYFFQNPELDVPSPSYLLHFLYTSDTPAIDANDVLGDDPGTAQQFGAGRFAQIPNVPVHHLDPYRLPVGKIASLIDFEEIWRNVALIEWPDKLGQELVTESHPPRLEINLSGIGPSTDGRQATFKAVGDRWQKVLREWHAQGYSTVEHRYGHGEHSRGGESSSTFLGKIKDLNPAVVQPEYEDKGKIRILGIESSCDDTGAAVVTGTGDILGECIASQHCVHAPYGGVVPRLAQEAHRANIDATVDTALERAQIANPSELTAVAVTVGPGLSMCLEVGVRKAYALAAKYKLPIVRIHHMEAHAMVTRMPSIMKLKDNEDPPAFPYLTLLVSGGHNMVVFSEDLGRHTILGQSMDDSVGEAFDKTARLCGITEVPGGPELEKLALKGDPRSIHLPKPLCKTRDQQIIDGCDFSFSGLKTAVRMVVEKEKEKGDTELTEICRANVAASFQRIAVNHLIERTSRALRWAIEMAEDRGKSLSALVVAGGVAANMLVRSELNALAESVGVPLMIPPPKYCVDNGVMVAWTGIERYRRGFWEHPPSESKATFFTEVLPKWPLGVRDNRSKGKAVAKTTHKRERNNKIDINEENGGKKEDLSGERAVMNGGKKKRRKEDMEESGAGRKGGC